MSVQIFAINSGYSTFKYVTTLGLPGITGMAQGAKGSLEYDARSLVNISAIENKYSGTISTSGGTPKQLFG